MRIDQMKQIIKIAECGSINKAARELHTSQSNISQSVQSLEEEIGQAIFQRTGKGVELTKFGEEFLNYAQATYDQFNMTVDFCKYYKKDPPLRFSVSSQYIRFANLLFIEIYKKYVSQDSEFSFLECSFLDVINNVSMHHAEIGLLVILKNIKKTTVNLLKSRGLLYHTLISCPPSVNVGKKHPLYNSKLSSVTLDMLKGYPMVVFRDSFFNYPSDIYQIARNIRKCRIIVSDALTLNEFQTNTDAFFIGAYTKKYQDVNPHAGYRTFKLQDERLALELGWIRSSSRPLSDLGKEYIKMLEASFKAAPSA